MQLPGKGLNDEWRSPVAVAVIRAIRISVVGGEGGSKVEWPLELTRLLLRTGTRFGWWGLPTLPATTRV